MSALNSLLLLCFSDKQAQILPTARQHVSLWKNWLIPFSGSYPAGEDPGYDDDFQRIREEVNKLSGADIGLICELAEKLFTTRCKDLRVATYYLWARLHRDGEKGLAEGLTLLSALLLHYPQQLLPMRANSRKSALEWLAGSRVLNSLSLHPEVEKSEFETILAALALIENTLNDWTDDSRPELGSLYSALNARLLQSGGLDALVPQNIATQDAPKVTQLPSEYSPELTPVHSGRELLERARTLSGYLREQPQGWLAANRLMKCLRWDTVHQVPPNDANGRTRLVAPREEYRTQLKRLYLQQNWRELLEQAERIFTEGVNHFWLDVQWYLYQALSKSGHPFEGWANIIRQDLRILLERLCGLEKMAYDNGAPFADEVTLGWINQHVRETPVEWHSETLPSSGGSDLSILSLEPEAVRLADAEGPEAALRWLQSQPGNTTPRQNWLLHLLMARVCEQFGKNQMALHLLCELNNSAKSLTLSHWEPELLFEICARRLRLLRLQAQRSSSDKASLAELMHGLTAQLVSLDPVRAAVLCE